MKQMTQAITHYANRRKNQQYQPAQNNANRHPTYTHPESITIKQRPHRRRQNIHQRNLQRPHQRHCRRRHPLQHTPLVVILEEPKAVDDPERREVHQRGSPDCQPCAGPTFGGRFRFLFGRNVVCGRCGRGGPAEFFVGGVALAEGGEGGRWGGRHAGEKDTRCRLETL